MDTATQQFIQLHRERPVTDVALSIRQHPEVDAAFALQQIEGWQKARTKLPELAANPLWIWPRRISMEQCSSQLTARFKQQLLQGAYATGADLTGGLGIDTFYLSEKATSWHYVEMQPDLADIAQQNLLHTRPQVHIHCTTAEDFLVQMPPVDLLFLDPARRDTHGGKVFRLQDCTPDVTLLYPALMQRCSILLLKLSPMLDLTSALRQLPSAREAIILAVRGEVKELLIRCQGQASSPAEDALPTKTPTQDISALPTDAPAQDAPSSIVITAVNLTSQGEERFSFTEAEEASAQVSFASEADLQAGYLFEPNAALLKAGAFRLICQRFALRKLSPSTHLYYSSVPVPHFPGRTFRILQVVDKTLQKALAGQPLNILTRNHPLRPEDLRKKFRTRDGGSQFLIGCRLADRPLLILTERV